MGGLLTAEGEDHSRNQRRVLNPAFGAAQKRELSGISFAEGNQVSFQYPWCLVPR
jgi:hypothetical protein